MKTPGKPGWRNTAICIAVIVPAMALAACGSNREDQLTQQLAEAKAAAADAKAAKQQAESDAAKTRDKLNSQSYAAFYGGDEAEGDEPVEDDGTNGPDEPVSNFSDNSYSGNSYSGNSDSGFAAGGDGPGMLDGSSLPPLPPS